MADTAAYLAQHVFPANVPVRQWVLSLPKALRARLGYDAELLARVVSIFVGALRRYLTHRAKRELGLTHVNEAHVGVVTAIQRFGSAAELNVHLHSLACDGVFIEENGDVGFRELAAPTTDDIAAVSAQVCRKVLAMLSKRGLWRDDVLVGDEEEPSVVAQLGAASVQGALVFAQGRRPIRLLGAAARTVTPGLKGYAFDVDAAVRVHGADRARLERLCRYILRPPIANDRLVKRSDGRFELRLKRAWSDGTTHLVFDGPELIARLAALVPPPRVHQVRYHGVFAPRAKLRPKLVRQVVDTSDEAHGCAEAHASAKRVRLPWAKLLARVFAADVLTCPRCDGGRLQRIAFITTTPAIRAILASVGLSTAPPVRQRASVSAQTELDWI